MHGSFGCVCNIRKHPDDSLISIDFNEFQYHEDNFEIPHSNAF